MSSGEDTTRFGLSLRAVLSVAVPLTVMFGPRIPFGSVWIGSMLTFSSTIITSISSGSSFSFAVIIEPPFLGSAVIGWGECVSLNINLDTHAYFLTSISDSYTQHGAGKRFDWLPMPRARPA